MNDQELNQLHAAASAIAAFQLSQFCFSALVQKNGGSAHEIAAVTGHATLAEVQRYTKAADRKRLAAQAGRTKRTTRSADIPESVTPAT